MAVNVPSKWDLIYMINFGFSVKREDLGFCVLRERIWWNTDLSSCYWELVCWYRNSCLAPGGRIKSLLRPAASIHSVRWASYSYHSTNVWPAGTKANWSRTKWQQSAGERTLMGVCILSFYSVSFQAQLYSVEHLVPFLSLAFLLIYIYTQSWLDIVAFSERKLFQFLVFCTTCYYLPPQHVQCPFSSPQSGFMMATWGRKCTSCPAVQVPAFTAGSWCSRIEQAQTRICKCFLFYLIFLATSIQNWTDKSMKVILFTKTSVEGGGGGGLARHAVLVLVLWWRWSWWRLDRRCLVGRLWRTKINVRDSLLPGFRDAETDFYFVVFIAGCLGFLLIHHCSQGQYCWPVSSEHHQCREGLGFMGFEELFIQAANYLESLWFLQKCELPSLMFTYWKLDPDWTTNKPTTNYGVLATSCQAILALQAANNLKAILDARHKTSPSLASCDFPWTALLLLAAESLLPLTVVSRFACLASVSFTGLSSSGFLCVETNQDKGLKAALHCNLLHINAHHAQTQKTDAQLRPSTKTT